MERTENPVARVVARNAAAAIEFFTEFNLDYSEAGIRLIDTICDGIRGWRQVMADQIVENALLLLADYLMETIHRLHGGAFVFDKEAKQPLLVCEPKGARVAVGTHHKLRARVKNGDDDAIASFYESFRARLANAQPGDDVLFA